MPTDHHQHLDPEEDALAKMGYELEDVDYKKLGRSIFWFFGFVVFCGVAGVIVFALFIGPDKILDPPAQTSPFVRRLPSEPNPLLQTNITARTDIEHLRREENALLHEPPTWLDESKGIVRVPVDEAMDKFLRQAGADPNQKTTIQSGAPPQVAPTHEEGAAEGGEH